MELVGSVNRIMKHQRKIHFTRSTKAKSFINRKSNISVKTNRLYRSSPIKNSLISERNKNKEHVNNVVNNNGIENKLLNENCRSNALGNSLKLKINKTEDVNCLNNNESEDKLMHSVLGAFTREVYEAICLRLGDTLHIPDDYVQTLFNDMKLYPSEKQVSNMLNYVKGSDRRLLFAEFCYLVRQIRNQQPKQQMQNQSPKQQRKTIPPKNTNNCTSKCDVFLGGSCNPTTWRTDTAIPELEKQGITFYNPFRNLFQQVSKWEPELVAQEYDAKQAASVLLFVIDSQTRSTVGMIEVAYLVASGRCVVVVAQPYMKGQSIMGETITDREYLDLVDGQKVLLDLVKTRGVKIHSNLSTALQCTANILRNSSSNGMSADDLIAEYLRKLREVYDSYGGQMKLSNVPEAYKKLTNRTLETSKLYKKLQKNSSSFISYQEFCLLVAENFTTDGYDIYMADVWSSKPLQRQTNNNNKCSLDSTHISCLIQPICPPPRIEAAHIRDVFLGGSLSSASDWRNEIAIPLLKKHGLTYYNPALREADDVNDRKFQHENEIDILEWKKIMDSSRVLLMVITNDTRSMRTIILAAYYIALNKDIVLCVQNLPSESCVINNETLTKNAVKDYNRARVYLKDLAFRKQISVFENITEAVECVIEKCQSR